MIPATETRRSPAAEARAVRPWWWITPPLVLLALGAVALARGHGLWYDEVYTAEMARVPLGELVSAFVHGEGTLPYLRDAPPSYNGPYYAIVHLWLAITPFGADEIGLRLLSLLAAVGAVAVFARAVARLAGEQRVAVVAGVFLAANPFVVQYAVEARGYALALLGTCVGALGLARWLDGERHAGLVLYAGGCAAAGVLHWYAVLVAVGFAVAAVVLRRRDALPVVAATALAALPAAVLAGVALANGVGSSGVEWLRGVGPRVPWLVLQSWSGRSVLLLAVTAVTAALGMIVAGKARTVAAAWVGVPLAVVTVAELVRPVFVDRYLFAAVAGIALLMAVGVARRPIAVTVAVVAVSLAATATDLRQPPKDHVREAVAAVAAQHQPGEPIVAAARWDALGVDHYGRRGHPELASDVVLPASAVPAASRVWVVRRAVGGVKGDTAKLDALDEELSSRGLAVTEERRFDGRYADVLVQRWDAAHASERAD